MFTKAPLFDIEGFKQRAKAKGQESRDFDLYLSYFLNMFEFPEGHDEIIICRTELQIS